MKRPQNINLRVRYTLLGLTLGLGGISALAATLTTFSAGDPISASSINANFSALNTSKLEIGQTLTGTTQTLNGGGTGTMTALLAEDGDFTINTVDGYSNEYTANQIKLDSSGGLYAKGQLGYGQFQTAGAGERFAWNPSKAAIRAGGVSGTQWNEAEVGYYSAAFGRNTMADGLGSFAVGDSTNADGSYAIAAGYKAHAYGTGSVALGSNTSAIGNYSFALGKKVQSCPEADLTSETGDCPFLSHSGVFLWGDNTENYLKSSADNQFSTRASGGYRLYSNAAMTTGCFLAASGTGWSCTSDKNAKTAFRDVDAGEVLEKVAALPIQSWQMKGQDAEIRHIGATAQDFRSAFGLGENDRSINSVDADGVALAAIQGLNTKLETENAELKRELNTLSQQNADLEARLSRLEQALGDK